MPNQLSRRGEISITELAAMRLGAGVRVDVVLQGGQRLEAPLAHGALVRALLAVRLHVAREEVPLGRRVVAVVAHVSLRHLLRPPRHHLHHSGGGSSIGNCLA